MKGGAAEEIALTGREMREQPFCRWDDSYSRPTLLSTSYSTAYDIEPGSAARIANHRDPADLFAQTVTCLEQLK